MEKKPSLKSKKIKMTPQVIDQQRKAYLAIECLVVFLVFASLYYVQIGKIPSFTPWILIVLFVIVSYLRLALHKKYYVVQKLGRTKGLDLLVKLLPLAALVVYYILPKVSGINAIVAGALAALYFYIEDTLTVYTPIEEYQKRNPKKQKTVKTKNNNRRKKTR